MTPTSLGRGLVVYLHVLAVWDSKHVRNRSYYGQSPRCRLQPRHLSAFTSASSPVMLDGRFHPQIREAALTTFGGFARSHLPHPERIKRTASTSCMVEHGRAALVQPTVLKRAVICLDLTASV